MTDRFIHKELLSRLGVTKQALSLRAKKIKDKYGPMTTEEAVYVIAHLEGLDLSRHLPLDKLDRVRALVPRPLFTAASSTKPQRTKKVRTKEAPGFPLVSRMSVRRAHAIGQESYPQVVILETSMRRLIHTILKKANPKWWPSLIHPDVIKNVQRIKKKESKYPYRERRGKDDILYCNFADLKLIVDHQYPLFQEVIVDRAWFDAKMDEVYMARNNLAHSILLSKDDISRIALFYRDWARLLQASGFR